MPNAVRHNALNKKKPPLNICCWPDGVDIFLGGDMEKLYK